MIRERPLQSLARGRGATRTSKKTARSRSVRTSVSCAAIVRRAASVSAVMQKSVSLRRSSWAARSIRALVGSSTRKPSRPLEIADRALLLWPWNASSKYVTSNGLTFQGAVDCRRPAGHRFSPSKSLKHLSPGRLGPSDESSSRPAQLVAMSNWAILIFSKNVADPITHKSRRRSVQMPMIQLIYASRTFDFDEGTLVAILTVARSCNDRDGITGR